MRLLVAALVCALATCRAKIMRNNALINKMMSQFQKDNSNTLSAEPREQPPDIPREPPRSPPREPPSEPFSAPPPQGDVMSLMQHVLCKNFPSVPCAVIAQDATLRRLIQKSIRQINAKQLSLQRTTRPYEYKTLFPAINSEDLSNFLQVQNTGYFEDKQAERGRAQQRASAGAKSVKNSKLQSNAQRTSVYGRKKLRKFYPHKLKYKSRHAEPAFHDYSDERLSVSAEPAVEPAVEPPVERTGGGQYAYRREPAQGGAWRARPAARLLGSLTKSKREQGAGSAQRRDVLHSDVYIKKNYIRKNSELLD
ncbi:uncharacterized protein [Battus philenor]|uniref:uncharacterized protein n=1 Tax=Battus philenor TaxID=42288 RepID=UPI0035D0875B